MKVVLVCESLYGNTEVLAAAVSAGLKAAGASTTFIEVGEAYTRHPQLAECDLLVVAAPTHALSLSRPESRADAVTRGADPRRQEIGVREWLATLDVELPASGPRPVVAVFDTRVGKAKHWPGSAAAKATRELRKAGFEVLERTSFYVDGVTGPVALGEIERALAWGTSLAKSRYPSLDGGAAEELRR
jgi:hypothetical protein